MLATEMTAIANTTHSTSNPIGTHRFAYPVVSEIRSRRTSSAHDASPSRRDDSDRALVALVYAARRGNDDAWARLIERFDPMLRKIARSFRLGTADVDDVVQATWTRLYSHIGAVRDPAAVGGWLATTARRQALSLLQAQPREQLVEDPDLGAIDNATPEAIVLESERHDAFMRALAALPARQRRVMTALVAQPDLDYQQLGALLEMPIGSIGPTRARGLAVLERDADLRRLHLLAG